MKPVQPLLFPSSVIDHSKPGDIRRRRSITAAEPIRARAAPAFGGSSSSSDFPATPAEIERARALTAELFAQLRSEGRDPSTPANVGAFRDEMLAQFKRSDPDRDYSKLLLPGGSLK